MEAKVLTAHLGVASFFTLLAAAGLVLVVALSAQVSTAATSYNFLVRGRVEAINITKNTVTVYTPHTSITARADLLNRETAYSVKNATFTQWKNGVKSPSALKNVKVGQEVVMHGTKTTGGTYNVDWLTINDVGFELYGRVKEVNATDKTMKVLVGRTSYKPAIYVNKNITLQWTPNTKCYRLGRAIECTNIPANQQLVKFVGDEAKEGHAWVITKAWDAVPQ